MRIIRPLKNDKGMAMLLALSMAGLLSMLGLYMVLQSKTAFRVTTASTRYESVFNLAEAALQLSLRTVRMKPPSLSLAVLLGSDPGAASTSEATPGDGNITSEVSAIGWDKNPRAGWSLNWQGYSAFHSVNYKCRGIGTIKLPSSQGDAKTAVLSFAARITQ